MIYNIRGTSGSGKTTAVQQVRAAAVACDPILEAGKIIAYELWFEGRPPLYLIGRYETPCGGCDTIKTLDEAIARIQRYAALGDVLAEGLLLSADVQRSVALAQTCPAIFAFLNTPVTVCLQRIQSRRVERGVTEPFNEQNTISRHRGLVKVAARLLAAGCDVRQLPYERATATLLEWLQVQPVEA